MTPGFAKSRKELFWLPYPEPDRVIINAHNFTPAAPDFSVNGKDPDSVWCPSLDDAGNGTTTLTDLVGSNNGTLTNFALTGSTSNWVSDTNAGGIRAIDADAVNDFVAVTVASYADFTLSIWINASIVSGTKVWFGIGTFWIGIFGGKATASIGGSVLSHHATYTTGWHHWIVTRASNVVRIYVDGVVGTSTATMTTATDGGTAHFANYAGQGLTFKSPGRFDDARLFGVSADASDVSYLYNSGAGRGLS